MVYRHFSNLIFVCSHSALCQCNGIHRLEYRFLDMNIFSNISRIRAENEWNCMLAIITEFLYELCRLTEKFPLWCLWISSWLWTSSVVKIVINKPATNFFQYNILGSVNMNLINVFSMSDFRRFSTNKSYILCQYSWTQD